MEFPLLKGDLVWFLLTLFGWFLSFCCVVICFPEELEMEDQERMFSWGRKSRAHVQYLQGHTEKVKVAQSHRARCLGTCQTPDASDRKLATVCHLGLVRLPSKDSEGKGASPGMQPWARPCHHIKECGHSAEAVPSSHAR